MLDSDDEYESAQVERKPPVIPLGVWANYLRITEKNPTTRILITGRSKSGKTTLALAIACRLIIPYMNRVILVCPSSVSQSAFQCLLEHVHEKDRHVTNASNELFQSILDSVRQEWNDSKRQKRTLLFLDDIAGDSCTNQGRKGAFANLINESNHIGLSIIGIFQQAAACSNVFRDNAEDIIIFPPARKEDMKKVSEEFIPYQYDEEKKERAIEIATYIWSEGDFLFIHRPPRDQPIMFKGFSVPIRI
jgi:energy-coupling factor transporter ATP-binding protein EcfA2